MPPSEILVIGYGNTLRRDDGVGIRVAEAVAGLKLPGVSVITRHQLAPELVAPVSQARVVVFIDAEATADGKPELRPIQAAEAAPILPHATDPRSLLALSKTLFGGSPAAWLLAIPVEDFGIGEGLSARAEA